jgi:hypothetical protein
MSREDKFVTMCTTLPFPEELDNRDERSVPELKTVAELRDKGQPQEAFDYAASLMKMYADLDLIPFMIAYMYYQRKYPDEALKIAVDAIPKCPRRYRLYSVAGLAELDRGKLPEAAVWWSRSVIAQCTVTDFQDHDPFLHLAHAAEILGMEQAETFFTMSDAIETSRLRLDAESINLLSGIKTSWARKPLMNVLKHIEETFLRG